MKKPPISPTTSVIIGSAIFIQSPPLSCNIVHVINARESIIAFQELDSNWKSLTHPAPLPLRLHKIFQLGPGPEQTSPNLFLPLALKSRFHSRKRRSAADSAQRPVRRAAQLRARVPEQYLRKLRHRGRVLEIAQRDNRVALNRLFASPCGGAASELLLELAVAEVQNWQKQRLRLLGVGQKLGMGIPIV